MPTEPNLRDALREELAETAQCLKEAKGPKLRLALLRRMKELLDEADRIRRENG